MHAVDLCPRYKTALAVGRRAVGGDSVAYNSESGSGLSKTCNCTYLMFEFLE